MADSVMIQGVRHLVVPVRRYVRPNGQCVDETMTVVATEKRESNLDLLSAGDLYVTYEQIPGNQSSLCVEDDEVDYDTELAGRDDASVTAALAALLDNVSPFGYNKIKRAYDVANHR